MVGARVKRATRYLIALHHARLRPVNNRPADTAVQHVCDHTSHRDAFHPTSVEQYAASTAPSLPPRPYVPGRQRRGAQDAPRAAHLLRCIQARAPPRLAVRHDLRWHYERERYPADDRSCYLQMWSSR